MSKQIQDAYIVAATRTPIGRSGRGYFRNTRPDDLLVAAIKSAMKQVPSLDPKAIEDAIVGCSFPEAEQWKVSREAQDAFALESHLRALKAQAAGEFTDEMTPIEVFERQPNLATGDTIVKTRTVNLDEGPRKDTSLEGLAKLKPVFAAK